jgi:hypothetical protein
MGRLFFKVVQDAPQPFNLHISSTDPQDRMGCKIAPIGFLNRLLDFADLPGFQVNVSRDGLFRQKRFGTMGGLRELVELCLGFFGDA